jgi:hypothetical protein
MTAAPTVTREQAALIAQLLRTIRPAWDQAATGKFVGEASREHRDLADLLHGCIRTAQDSSLASPVTLTWAGEHWQRTVRATESAEERAARIQAQIDAREERERGYSLNGEQKARIAAAKAAARQALADAAAARKTEPTVFVGANRADGQAHIAKIIAEAQVAQHPEESK